jgi:ADP-heptose:LPS heptosyltransferase
MLLKRIELAWRRLWIRLLVRLMRRPREPKPDWNAAPQRVLFLRHDRAGDMILSTGIMRAIARSHPTITLDVLASPVNAAILDAADDVGEVIVFDKKRLATYLPTAARLRRARYDAVIDCMVTSPSLTTLLLIFASGARHRVGIAGRGNDAAFTITVPPETRPDAHIVDHLAALLPAFDVDPKRTDLRPTLALTAAERQNAERIWTSGPVESSRSSRILINVSAGTSARLWDDENYAAIMRHLRGLDPTARFRVIGAPAEMDRAAHVAERGGGGLVRTPSIRDAFALVATADFIFTPDTSIAHAAAAFRRSCVAMYIAGTVTRWGIYGAPAARSVEHPAPTLRTLSVDRMIQAIDQAWSERSAPVSRSG